MTQEEKAKAYDEALERARALRQEAIDKEYAIDYVKDYEAIFPELAESEDERIRKEIIEYLWDISNQTPLVKESLDCRRWIAYLEKQKEQKTAECGCTNNESEYDKGYREGHRFGLKQTQEFMLPGGKTFSGLIPCWVNAPSELQPAHKYHGKNVVVMHENNGGFRCTCIDEENATTFHLPEDTLFVEGWRKKPAEWSGLQKEK